PPPAVHVHNDAPPDVSLITLSFLGVSSFAAAQPQESLAEAHKLLVHGMQRLEIDIGCPCTSDLHQDGFRIAQRRGLIDHGAQFTRVQASATSKTRIFQYGEIERDFCGCFVLWSRRQIVWGGKARGRGMTPP